MSGELAYIPKGCRECPEVGKILCGPVPSFYDVIEKLTGKRVAAWGGIGVRRLTDDNELVTVWVMFDDGSKAMPEEIVTATAETQMLTGERETKVQKFCEGCLGMVSAVAEVDGTSYFGEVCGRVVLERFSIAAET